MTGGAVTGAGAGSVDPVGWVDILLQTEGCTSSVGLAYFALLEENVSSIRIGVRYRQLSVLKGNSGCLIDWIFVLCGCFDWQLIVSACFTAYVGSLSRMLWMATLAQLIFCSRIALLAPDAAVELMLEVVSWC